MAKATINGRNPYNGEGRDVPRKEPFEDKVRRIYCANIAASMVTASDAAKAIGRDPRTMQRFVDGGSLSMQLWDDIWMGCRFDQPEQYLAMDPQTQNTSSYRDIVIMELQHLLTNEQLKQLHNIIARAHAVGVLEALIEGGELWLGNLLDDLDKPGELVELRASQRSKGRR